MDIIDYIEIPSFERRRDRFKRGVTVLTGTVALAVLLEKYNACISRSLKSARRGLAAAITSWLEDQHGDRLFALGGDEPPPVTNSALELSALGLSPASWTTSHQPTLPRPRGVRRGREPAPAAAGAQQTHVVVTSVDEAAVTAAVAGSASLLQSRTPSSLSHLTPHAAPPAPDERGGANTPQFFQSTKFFAVLEVDEARELFHATTKVSLQPHEVLFTAGQASDAGIYIVVSGSLGVYVPVHSGGPPVHTNTLRYGESVGDLDVVDGAPRTVTCMALEDGCTMVQLSRPVFMAFVRSHPRALLQYLQQGLARLWRVAHFMLSDFLMLTLHKPTPDTGRSQTWAAGQEVDDEDASREARPRALAREAQTQTSPLYSEPSSAAQAGGSSAQGLSPQRDPSLGVGSAQLQGSSSALSEGLERHGTPVPAAAVTSKGVEGRGRRRSTRMRHAASDGTSLSSQPHRAEQQQLSGAAGASEEAGQTAAGTDRTSTAGTAGVLPHLHSEPALGAVTAAAEEPGAPLPVPPLQAPDPAAAADANAAAAAAVGGLTDAEVRAGLQAAAEKLSALHAQQVAREQESQRTSAAGQTARDTSAHPATSATAATSSGAARGQLPERVAVGPYCRLQPSPALRRTFEFGQRACLADGWDVVDVEELGLSQRTWARLSEPRQTFGAVFPLARGGVLQEVDWACGQFFLLLDGHLLAERKVPAPPGAATRPIAPAGAAPAAPGGLPGLGAAGAGSGNGQPGDAAFITETGVIRPGSAISCAAFLSCTSARCRVVALEPARLLAFGWQHLEALCTPPPTPEPSGYGHPGANPAAGLHGLSGSGSGLLRSAASGSLHTPVSHHRAHHRGAHGGTSGRSHDSTPSHLQPRHSGTGAAGPSPTAGPHTDVEEVLLPLLVAAAAAMGPLIRRFISLGLNRVWLKSGDVAYRQGDEASCLYVVISGRLRLLHEYLHPGSAKLDLRVEEEVGRGEAVGVVWTIAGGQHDTTALCVRDSELVRMSKGAFKIISEDSPLALSRLFSNIARRLVAAWDARMRGNKVSGTSLTRSPGAVPPAFGMAPPSGPARLDAVGSTAAVHNGAPRADIVTIAILPAGVMPAAPAAAVAAAGRASKRVPPPGVASLLAVKRVSAALKEALLGQLAAAAQNAGAPPGARVGAGSVVVVDSTSMGLRFPVAFERLDVLFYRSKLTSWLSAQEEEARFILLEADYHPTPWSSVCVAQADVILLVAAEGAQPDLGECEAALVWSAGLPPGAGLAHGTAAGSTAGLTSSSTAVPAAHAPTRPGQAAGVAGPAARVYHRYDSGSVDTRSAPAPTMSQLLHGHESPGGPGMVGAAGAHAAGVSPLVAAANAAAASDGRSQRATVDIPHPPHAPHMAQPGASRTGSVAGTAAAGAPAVRPPLPAVVRRVELVQLHPPGAQPQGTAGWLDVRPHLARHHHICLDREADVARLARWMRGRAVGLVLSGGGSRGLAHLGVLCALEDAGVAVDVVGGTSQGALMAGLYAQGLSRERLQVAVQQYAQRLGSVRHLLADLTLPLLSVFTGRAFDDTLQSTFALGPGNIEDLWLPFFCVSTNLSRGEPSVHSSGCLWKLVRASMTIVGLLPPMTSDAGDLLVDGGYMNNLPVDVMRGLGVDTVIVVDVESRDDMGWHSLTPYDGGVSGWRLLWDRLCPVPSWRTNIRMPRYAQIVHQLTWMTHAHNLKRVHEDYRIDLYLRPPYTGTYKLMDFPLMERIVRDAYRYASLCLTNWPALPQVATLPAGSSGSSDGHAGMMGSIVGGSGQLGGRGDVLGPLGSPTHMPLMGFSSPAGGLMAGPGARLSTDAGLQGPPSSSGARGGVSGALGAAQPQVSSISCMSQLQVKQTELLEVASASLVASPAVQGGPRLAMAAASWLTTLTNKLLPQSGPTGGPPGSSGPPGTPHQPPPGIRAAAHVSGPASVSSGSGGRATGHSTAVSSTARGLVAPAPASAHVGPGPGGSGPGLDSSAAWDESAEDVASPCVGAC